MELLIKLAIFVSLFCIGWYFGRRAEQKHLAQLARDEARLSHIRVDSRRLVTREQSGQLMVANVVISHDYFKMVWANIHAFLGGRLKTYESLLERGRREAIVRLKQQAQQINAHEILAVRLHTTELGMQGGMIEVIAYGTAIQSNTQTLPPPLTLP